MGSMNSQVYDKSVESLIDYHSLETCHLVSSWLHWDPYRSVLGTETIHPCWHWKLSPAWVYSSACDASNSTNVQGFKIVCNCFHFMVKELWQWVLYHGTYWFHRELYLPEAASQRELYLTRPLRSYSKVLSISLIMDNIHLLTSFPSLSHFFTPH